jgi:hypothetical protein
MIKVLYEAYVCLHEYFSEVFVSKSNYGSKAWSLLQAGKVGF